MQLSEEKTNHGALHFEFVERARLRVEGRVVPNLFFLFMSHLALLKLPLGAHHRALLHT